jgi:tetratricopeptide (TPR) repeat protein
MFIAPNSAKYLIPVGFLFEVRAEPTTNEEIITTDDEWKNKFLREEMIPQNLDFRAIGAWADLFASRGAFFYERKLYERAAENYEWALKVEENIAEVWFGYGIVLKSLQRWKDSAMAFEKALQLDPRMLGVRYQLAQLNLAAGYIQDAITLLEEELKLNPDNQSAKELLEKAKR